MDKARYLQIRKQCKFEPQNMKLIQQVGLDIGLISFFAFAINRPVTFPFAILSYSILMFRSFSMMHDAVHGSLSKNKLVNEFFGYFYGGISLLPYTLWKKSHLQHHYWSGNLKNDPVMALRTWIPNQSRSFVALLTFFWNNWVPVLAGMQYGLFWLLSFNSIKRTFSLKDMISFLSPIIIGLSLCSIFGLGKYSFVFVSALVIYFLGIEIVNFPHHLHVRSIGDEMHLPAWEQEVTARSCLYPVWFSEFVILNFNYHIEHHMFPDAPWYDLPALNKKLAAENLSSYQVERMFDWTREARKLDLYQLVNPNSDVKGFIQKAG